MCSVLDASMNQFPRRRTDKSSDRLDSIIRNALEERVANAEPPDYARQVLLARARESQMKRKLPYALPSVRLPDNLRPVSSALWAYNTGTGYYRRDSHLGLAITNFTNPLLGLMR
jgi:hypothetical protein